MICNKCGVQFNSPFCPNCGTPARTQAQQSSSPNILPHSNQPTMQPVWESFRQPKKKMNGCLLALIITACSAICLVVLFSILIALFSFSNNTSKNHKESISVTKAPIEYTAYTVTEMMNDLDNNALKAEKKYSDQYVEITGKLSNIDSDGKYIDLIPTDEVFAIIGVQCYIKSDDQANKVMEMSKGDIIKLKGKITSVGEVLGYSLNIIEIE